MATPSLIQLRRGTASTWTSVNPVLLSGELAVETDTKRMKIGDGVTAWNSLDYMVFTIISKQVSIVNGGLASYTLDSSAPFGYIITGVRGIRTGSGTVTANLAINGTSVTGLGVVAVTTTPQTISATALNKVNVGDRLTVAFTNGGTAQNVEFTLAALRVS